MTREQKLVRRLRKMFHHKDPHGPHMPPFRVKLDMMCQVAEEISILKKSVYTGDMERIAEMLCRMIMLLYKVALVFGLDLEQMFREVLRSEMTKKTDCYDPPILLPMIARQESRAKPERDEL